MSSVAIGVDLGTSGVKVVAVSRDGELVARARRGYATARPELGAAEQNPHEWTDAVMSALHEIDRIAPASSWAVIGLSAMLPTLVELDASGEPIGAAIVWEDARAEPEGEAFVSAVGGDRLYEITGQIVDGRYLVPMHHRLNAFTRATPVATIAGAKDYVFQFLTGELLTDPSTAAGFALYDIESGDWDADLVSVAGDVRVPPVASSTDHRPLLASLSAELGCQPGLPVVVGAADSVLGAYGLDANAEGDVVYIAGTSTVILGCAATPVLDRHRRYLVTPMADAGFGLEMDLLATGSAMAWLASVLGVGGGASELAEAARGVPVRDAPLFLPYLAPGEQGALWDPTLTGTLHGLNQRMGREHIVRALVSGIVVESRRCLEVLREVLPGSAGTIKVSGSGGSSPVFRQDLADASGRPVEFFPESSDHSALGAALLAGRAVGDWSSLRLESSVVEPDSTAYEMWAEIAAQFDGARAGLRNVLPKASR